ncbi:hypothetical protein ACVIWV_008616 [Bradyrhizobium diazoefficiens]|uniref:hypothetical protein n=1 Tax=Bradyrhizobium TaxID=374 RepID=UPI000ACD6B63|nr:hypothetical protein [Bradyrhizobium diazoefficiens]MBR0868606.1 hypothetical protein [Bradyrhizobium diazoefficiens]MBR0893149.1 hypothetical protein [Bradyrhizobium diazoefficiens]MBR0924772.1 hypothetical protein [Bradyrhizobium diazoefficiens]WLA69698.1 hypothetical protein QNN01_04695 [Bradyrhizobium diazoefficiens]
MKFAKRQVHGHAQLRGRLHHAHNLIFRQATRGKLALSFQNLNVVKLGLGAQRQKILAAETMDACAKTSASSGS